MYEVVRITVKEIRQYCPFYRPGDVFFIRQQCFDPATATPQQFCVHSLNDLYETYMRVRQGPIGGRETLGCFDEGIVQFEIERLPDEEGEGWGTGRRDPTERDASRRSLLWDASTRVPLPSRLKGGLALG